MENRSEKHPIPVKTHDRLFLAWQASIAMVRLLEALANEEGIRSEAGRLFAEAAEDECRHASRLLSLLEAE